MSAISRLFLLCPSDHLEKIVLKHIKGKALFYTSLGGEFNFDASTQYDLLNLIENHEVNEIVILLSVQNLFIKGSSIGNQNVPDERKANLDSLLCMDKDKLGSRQNEYQSHLIRQKNILLSTALLGDQLRQRGIAICKNVFSSI